MTGVQTCALPIFSGVTFSVSGLNADSHETRDDAMTEISAAFERSFIIEGFISTSEYLEEIINNYIIREREKQETFCLLLFLTK